MAAAVLTTKAAEQPALADAQPQSPPNHDLPVPLPALLDANAYNPCTFDYEGSGIDSPACPDREVCLREWIDVFRHSTPTFARHIEDGAAHEQPDAAKRSQLASRFSAEFPAALDAALEARRQSKTHGLGTDPTTGKITCISLCHLRDEVLHALGLRDIFLRVKREEDAAALKLLPGVLKGLDGIQDPKQRLELAVRGVLAGNVFDLGAAASAELFAKGEGGGAEAFFRTRDERLLPRPWAVDDLDALVGALVVRDEEDEHNGPSSPPAPRTPPYKKAVLFADNAGSDVLLGLVPLARELLRLGVPSVVLAANTHPTLNDTTAAELEPLLKSAAEADALGLLPKALSSRALRVVASGNELPVIDLRRCSPELAREFSVEEEGDGGLKNDDILLVLEGMGRGIETNLRAAFRCDALRIGVIKHPEVARCLQGRLYDPVVRFTRGGERRSE
jgi:type II pantothenate kinase